MHRLSAEANINLYITAEHPCPYLPERFATNILVDPCFRMTGQVYNRLLQSGFRRSGVDVYRPHCKACKACISTRIPVDKFTPNRSQKRNFKHNADLRVHINRGEGFKPSYDTLYSNYINHRHHNGGMDSDGIEAFSSFLLGRWSDTLLIEFHDQDQLLAVAAVDLLESGLSAVYTFFDPIVGEERGLGTYAVLWQIHYAQQLGLNFVYPGYWISESPKMNYKINFQPMEGLYDGAWRPLDKATTQFSPTRYNAPFSPEDPKS